jgi:PhnB protein
VTAPTPYVHFPGTAREALTFYGEVFGCSVQLHTFEEFQRTDGPADAIAHGYLNEGPVRLFGADVAGKDPPVRCQGLMLSLLGTAAPSTLRKWFVVLSEGGKVLDDLQVRPWGDSDGQVVDRHGLHWLIGFEGTAGD